MTKQYAAHHVSWRDSRRRPGPFSHEAAYGRAAASALEEKLNDLAQDGWIVDQIIPARGFTPQQCSAYTVVVFK
jgi:hypothetical protein